MGGEKNFVSTLDEVFSQPPSFGGGDTRGDFIHEMREMQVIDMGQYAHGNQPIQHMIYLYDYAGEPWKTQYWIREAMTKLYQPTPDGYCGDEDNGQTSAWYVFSSLGFYSVCPGSNQYVIGSPQFKSAKINLENGKQIVIHTENNSPDHRYIDTLKMNGEEYDKNYFTYADFMKGVNLDFEMSAKPNYERGTQKADFPYSLSNEE